MTRDDIIDHAAACREALDAGQPRPQWQGGDLSGADLSGANLSGASLSGADLTDADITDADLTGADLSGANLRGAYLIGANITDADITDADLSGANLRGANLRGANLRGANIAEGTVSASAAGHAGGYHWHALRAGDVVILQYGCDRATLAEWQTRGPEYGARHHRDEAHWATGPAVAIAAAEALLTT